MALVGPVAFRDDDFAGWNEGIRVPASPEEKMIATLEQPQTTVRANQTWIVASLQGVSKNYGSIRALRGVNFSVRAGEVVALLGPNGAGKTTAVKLLLGLLPPSAGQVRVFGGDPANPENRM